MADNPATTGQAPRPEENRKAATSVQPVESEAPSQTGGKGAEHRALDLNVAGKQAQRHPDTPAGQHATGSFTGPLGGGPSSGSSPGKG